MASPGMPNRSIGSALPGEAACATKTRKPQRRRADAEDGEDGDGGNPPRPEGFRSTFRSGSLGEKPSTCENFRDTL